VDHDSRILIDYLQSLPRRAVVHWSSHHVSIDEPWTTDWIDVRIVDPGAPPFNWAWTIIGQDDPHGTPPGQLWQFVWPYDVGGSYGVRGGWTVGTIGEALSHWTATHAGRRDLSFEWDPEAEPDPIVQRVIERARAMDDGAPVHDLGDGLVVADGLMDELLAMDPDEREALIGRLREAHQRLSGDPESAPPPSRESGPADD